MTNDTIVIYEGCIFKWSTLKDLVPAEFVTMANADEVRLYYMMKLR